MELNEAVFIFDINMFKYKLDEHLQEKKQNIGYSTKQGWERVKYELSGVVIIVMVYAYGQIHTFIDMYSYGKYTHLCPMQMCQLYLFFRETRTQL